MDRINQTENEKLICDKCDGECGDRRLHCKYIPAPEDFDDDFGEGEICESCQSDKLWEECWSCGGEGGTDGEELMMEDPMWYGPDDFRRCDICNGKGGFYVCPSSTCRNDG